MSCLVLNLELTSTFQNRSVREFLWQELMQSLEELMSFADQFSRECFSCEVKDSCKWKTEEKIDYAYFDIETKLERKKGGEQ